MERLNGSRAAIVLLFCFLSTPALSLLLIVLIFFFFPLDKEFCIRKLRAVWNGFKLFVSCYLTDRCPLGSVCCGCLKLGLQNLSIFLYSIYIFLNFYNVEYVKESVCVLLIFRYLLQNLVVFSLNQSQKYDICIIAMCLRAIDKSTIGCALLKLSFSWLTWTSFEKLLKRKNAHLNSRKSTRLQTPSGCN